MYHIRFPESIKFICANKFYVDQKYMHTVCYAISKSPKQLPSYLKIAEINYALFYYSFSMVSSITSEKSRNKLSIVLLIFNGILYHILYTVI